MDLGIYLFAAIVILPTVLFAVLSGGSSSETNRRIGESTGGR